MFHYILRRLLTLIPFLLAVSALASLLMYLAPGDYLDTLKLERDISPEMIERQRQEFALDEPWIVQYWNWLGNAVQGDFGHSFGYRMPVVNLIGERLMATFLLSLTSLMFAWSVAIPLGVLAAIYKDSIFDRLSTTLAYAALSIPEFFLALLAIFFAATTGILPFEGATSIGYEYMSTWEKIVDRLHHLILPTIVIGIGSVAGIMRIMRSSFLDYIRAEYVTTARAKGMAEGIIMFRHVLRNAINPLISSFGFAFSSLLSGSLIVENILNYPGLGQLLFQALIKEDQFVVLTAITMSCTMLVLGNLLADILLALSDPRIRLEKK